MTDEFCFKLARGHAVALRLISVVLGFVLPLAALMSGINTPILLTLTGFACLLGLLAERWLFFAEAEHVVRLYHGASRV